MSEIKENCLTISGVELTFKKDITAFGNKYWIQIQDKLDDNNNCLEELIDKSFHAVIVGTEKPL